jgi:hypothetical protein
VISVVLPVIKTVHLEEALTSLLAQTCRDFELIVVDNAAEGDVAGILDRHPDDRVRLVRHDPRLPVIANWNRCLEYAGREWFLLASDDDAHEPGYVAAMLDLAGRHPGCDLLHSRVAVVDDAGRRLRLAPACPEWESVWDLMWHRLQFFREQFVSDFTWRTAALRDAGGFVDFPGAWFTDEATAYAVAARGGVACAPQPLFRYRESAFNLTSTARVEAKLEAVCAFDRWLREFLAGPAAACDPALREQLRDLHARRTRHMKYRELLLGGAKGLPAALGVVRRHGRRLGLSYRELLLAGIAAAARRALHGG